jgi:dolichol-phosphate mannosyltransferase
MSQVELSFVFPAYNEKDFIEGTLTMVDVVVKDKLQHDIIMVDYGSKDRTLSKAITYGSKNDHVRVVSYARNVGRKSDQIIP